ncbi:unnamed protein product [Agarophyton chilense]
MAFIPLITTSFVSGWATLPERNKSFIRPRVALARKSPTAVAFKAREVSAQELEKVLQANERPLVVDAFAKWCGPCQYLIPQLDIVADKFGERLDIVKLDTELYPDLASALMIKGLPTLFFIKDGKLQYRMEGALGAPELEKLIDYILFNGPPLDAVENAETS